jgi:hypothetical protein
LLLLILALPATDCIEPRLTIDINTRIEPDGSCTRRVEYRYERREPALEANERIAAAMDKDPLEAFYRFPSGPVWTLRDETQGNLHSVLSEGRLSSPEGIDGDYWRKNGPRVLPARNHVSYVGDADSGEYDYFELFLDPASPLATNRYLAERLVQKDGHFAAFLERKLGAPKRTRRTDFRRLFRERFAQPFLQEATLLAASARYGPRERQALQQLQEKRFEALAEDLKASILAAMPSADPEALQQAVRDAMEEVTGGLLEESSAAGMPLAGIADEGIRFHATLTMPAPISRANGCPQGDTISWDFTQEDVYGRGFEMWARAQTPR